MCINFDNIYICFCEYVWESNASAIATVKDVEKEMNENGGRGVLIHLESSYISHRCRWDVNCEWTVLVAKRKHFESFNIILKCEFKWNGDGYG